MKMLMRFNVETEYRKMEKSLKQVWFIDRRDKLTRAKRLATRR
jgi:hypothetical protein